MEPMARVSSAAMGFAVAAGARDEPADLSGVSHFLEHMTFKGTARRTAAEINLAFDEMGAIWNAFTEWELTAYYGWVPADQTPGIIELLSDMMRPTLPSDEFDMEKKVILEEIAMYNDQPGSIIFDHLISAAWGPHPLGNSVLGTSESVSGIAHDRMQAYWTDHYSPDNMKFVITGRLDPDAVIEQMERCCGSWEPSGRVRQQPAPGFAAGDRVTQRDSVTREHLAMAWPAPKVADAWEPTAKVLARVLGDASNSRLFWTVIQEGLADEIAVLHHGFCDAGMLYLYASVDPSNVEVVLNRIGETFADVQKGVSEEELTRAKNRHATAVVGGGESPMSRWGQLVEPLKSDAPLPTIEDDLADIDAINAGTLIEYLSHHPADGAGSLVGLGPMAELT